METVGVWLLMLYEIIMLFCNYLTKEVAMCVPGGQGSASMPYRPTQSDFQHCTTGKNPIVMIRMPNTNGNFYFCIASVHHIIIN